MEVPGIPNVYAIGDCAAFKENPLPQTAQVAQQEGFYIAKFLNAKAKLNPSGVLSEDVVLDKVRSEIGTFRFNFRGQLGLFFQFF
jgi:NADH dehydrogenase FAD-containing subunit